MTNSPIRSDVLKEYRRRSEDSTQLPIVSLFQVHLIVDANVVIRELIWATTKRKNPLARSELMEVLHAETVIAWAPTFLKDEVEKHIDAVVRKGAHREDVWAHWTLLQALIKFEDVGDPPADGAGYRDAKDLPYIWLQRKIEAIVVTKDDDIAAMGGRVVPVTIMASLRAYSRAAAVQVTLQVGTYQLGGLSLAALTGALRSLSSLVKKCVERVPREVWMVLLSILLITLLVPAAREWMQARVRSIAERLGSTGEDALLLFNAMACELEQRKLATQQALSEVQAMLASADGVQHDAGV